MWALWSDMSTPAASRPVIDAARPSQSSYHLRTRWAAVGAAVAVSLGAGGISLIHAASPEGAAALVPITPCRLFDTRPAFQVGPRNTPLGAEEIYDVTATGAVGQCNVPAEAVGLSLNVTAVDATLNTFLTLFPAGAARPNASHLNPAPGQPPTPNAVTTDIDDADTFSIFNKQGTVHVFADVVGYYTDHDHDDAYYTEAEIDAKLAALPTGGGGGGGESNRFVSIDPLAVFGSAPVTLGGDPQDGIDLAPPISGPTGDFGFGFTLPPDYTPNGGIAVELIVAYPTTALCNVDLRLFGDRLAHVGSPWVADPFLVAGGAALLANDAAYEAQVLHYSLVPKAGQTAEPGDSVVLSFLRAGTGTGGTDTCGQHLYVSGISVTYL